MNNIKMFEKRLTIEVNDCIIGVNRMRRFKIG